MLDLLNASTRFDAFVGKYIQWMPLAMLGFWIISIIMRIMIIDPDNIWLRGDIVYIIDQLVYLPLWGLAIILSIEFGYCLAHRVLIYFFMFESMVPVSSMFMSLYFERIDLIYFLLIGFFALIFSWLLYVFFHIIPGKERKEIEDLKRQIKDLEIEIGIRDNME